MRRQLASALFVASCQVADDSGTDLGPDLAEDLTTAMAHQSDLRSPADLSVLPDMKECSPNMPMCAGPWTLCAQDSACRPCGGEAQACCASGLNPRFCRNGLTCVGCSPTAWGIYSRCQATEGCGTIGQSCCWKWASPCGASDGVEWCTQGTCVNHRCAR